MKRFSPRAAPLVAQAAETALQAMNPRRLCPPEVFFSAADGVVVPFSLRFNPDRLHADIGCSRRPPLASAVQRPDGATFSKLHSIFHRGPDKSDRARTNSDLFASLLHRKDRTDWSHSFRSVLSVRPGAGP